MGFSCAASHGRPNESRADPHHPHAHHPNTLGTHTRLPARPSARPTQAYKLHFGLTSHKSRRSLAHNVPGNAEQLLVITIAKQKLAIAMTKAAADEAAWEAIRKFINDDIEEFSDDCSQSHEPHGSDDEGGPSQYDPISSFSTISSSHAVSHSPCVCAMWPCAMSTSVCYVARAEWLCSSISSSIAITASPSHFMVPQDQDCRWWSVAGTLHDQRNSPA